MAATRGQRIRSRLLHRYRAVRERARVQAQRGWVDRPISVVPLIFGEPAVLVRDSFNRNDNALSLGNAETGQAWTEIGAAALAIGIVSGRAVGDGAAGDDGAYVETDRADVDISADVQCSEPGISYILLRYSAADALIIVGADNSAANNFAIWRNNAGWSLIGNWASDPGTTVHQLRVVAKGSSIQLFVAGVLRISVTETFNQTETKHRCWLRATSALDNFIVKAA